MPKQRHWGEEDLIHYKNWYSSWIDYIDTKISHKNLPKNPHVLEIGSGIGGVAALLAGKGWKVTGSDISREIVKAANKTHRSVQFVYCDAQKKIPGKYNMIVAFEVLEHIENPSTAIRNVCNSLKKNGLFIGSSPYPFSKAYSDPTHCSVNYPKKWKQIFHNEGFKKVSLYPLSFFPYLWRIHRRLNVVLPFYISLPWFVSTTLIIAQK